MISATTGMATLLAAEFLLELRLVPLAIPRERIGRHCQRSSMTPAQIQIVQRTFAKIELNAPAFSALFYDRMFTIAPHTRGLFRGDLQAQHAKFMKVVAEVVRLHLRALISLPVTSKAGTESAIPGADRAGQMHHEYGVKSEDYTTMKDALLWALRQSLGFEFDKEAQEAWSRAYDILADAMRSGADPTLARPGETRASRFGDLNGRSTASEFLKGLGDRSSSQEDE
ncbi:MULTISPECIES: globin domain-containing protein [Rhodomicrobium]|uniref:globin domain-containing protein n=1 Tax=Rhodomicrobium TaxID=1068 RepID=UPI000B4B8AE2|nr:MULTISPECIES: globin domain-containing protein [Rhodomicrobium]